MKTKYKLQSKYPSFYKDLESALDMYADSNELVNKTYQEIAQHVLDFCNTCFDYVPNHQQRIVEYLQGLGLNIQFYNVDIYELAYTDKLLYKTDSDNKHLKFLDTYWDFMAMRLKNIARI